MADFRDRLRDSLARGGAKERERRDAEAQASAAQAALRKAYADACAKVLEGFGDRLRDVREVIGGFRLQALADGAGEGWALSRTDDLISPDGRPLRAFSRIEMRLTPFDGSDRVAIAILAVVRNIEKPKLVFARPATAFDLAAATAWAEAALASYAQDFADDDETREGAT